MYKTALLATTALGVVSMTVLGAVSHAVASPLSNRMQVPSPGKARILYNQNSNSDGIAVSSENFTSDLSMEDDQAADDFVIPTSQSWRLTEVDVSGVYYDGSGPAQSEDVIFYKNKKGLPGKAIKKGTFKELLGADDHGNFAIVLPKGGLRLKAGHYWVSVIATISFEEAGNWGWNVNSTQHGDPAVWQNPGGGYGFCRSWGTIQNCLGYGPDLMFALKGTSK